MALRQCRTCLGQAVRSQLESPAPCTNDGLHSRFRMVRSVNETARAVPRNAADVHLVEVVIHTRQESCITEIPVQCTSPVNARFSRFSSLLFNLYGFIPRRSN
jgi:hypothetical protein